MGLDREVDRLQSPEKLNSSHRVDKFDCGNLQLDDWLKRRALKNESDGLARTFVLSDDKANVIAYYCIASGAVAKSFLSVRIRPDMPDPIPVMVIGKLAVDRHWQGQGIGSALLKDAVLRILKAAEIVGVRAILAHTNSEDANKFYEKFGFTASPIDSNILILKISTSI